MPALLQPKRFADAGQYLRELAAEEADISRCSVSGTGLLPEDSPEAAALHRGEAVPLRWSWLAGRKPNRLYLGHWCGFRLAVLETQCPRDHRLLFPHC